MNYIRIFSQMNLISNSFIIFIMLNALGAFGQGKLAVSISNPSKFELCIPSDDVQIEVRNITTSSVTGIECELILPTGVTYIPNSISSNQVTEKTITNLSRPIFSVNNLNITQAGVFRIKLNIGCAIAGFLNNGGLAIIRSTTSYTGGSVDKSSSPFNVQQASLQITNVTNQLKTANLQEIFVRTVTLKNSGTGRLANATFYRIYQSGLQLITAQGGTIKFSGDTVFSYLDSAAFMGIGNNDQYFDLNETITLTDTIKVISCSNLITQYRAFWGCNGSTCGSTSSSANVSISSRSPDVVVTTKASTSNCLNGTLLDQQVTLYNKGNDTARSVNFHAFQSYSVGYYSYILTEMVVNSFTMSTSMIGTDSSITPYNTNNTYNLGAYSCLSSSPVGGAFFTLPNMAPGDSLILRWKTKSCCPQTCNATNFYFQRWKCEVDYIDQCNKKIQSGEVWGSAGFLQSNVINKFVPTDISDGETKRLEYTFSNGNLLNPINSSQAKVELILSAGLTHSKTAADFKFAHANGTSWTPSYFTQNGDTITAYFKGVPTVTLSRSELLIDITGTCTGISTNKNATYKVNFSYNPDTLCSTNCYMPIYCNADVIRIHCATSCNSGMHFKGFNAVRTSFGQPDNNNDGEADATGSLDFDKIKRNRIMFGDTVLATFSGVVYFVGRINNWYYAKATSTIAFGSHLSVADVRVKVYRRRNLLFTCNNITHSSSISGNNKTFTFDIGYNNLVNSGCVISSTFAYTTYDSVALEVTYVVDKNPGNASHELKMTNNFFVSSVSNPTNSSQFYQCDTFSARLSLNGSFYLNYARNNLNNSNCNAFNASQNFYLSIGPASGNYAGGNLFPNEYRKWARLQEIIVKKDPGFDLTNAAIIQYRTKGTGGTAWERYLSINPYASTPTELKFRIDSLYTDNGGNIKISDDGFYGIFTTSWLANCKANGDTTDLEYDFVFENQGILGNALDTVNSGIHTDKIIYSKPAVQISLANDNVYADQDTVEWDIRIKNSSNTDDLPYAWLGAYKTNNVRLVEVVDLITNKPLVKNNDIFIINSISKGGQQDYKIRAVFKDCNRDSLLLRFGSNCTSFPDSISAYPCNTTQTILYFEPINTRLEAILSDTASPVDLCEEKQYNVEIRNTGSPKVFNSYLDILMRPGMVLSDTAWLKIEGRADSVAITNALNVAPNTYRWQLAEQDSILKNSGLNGVKSSNGYIMRLRFGLSTNCSFTSSTFFLLRPGGTIKCGQPVNAAFTVGEPIDIKNVVKPYYSAVSLEMPHLDACNFNGTSMIKFINLGPDTTGINDRILVSLPPGVEMDTTFIGTGHNRSLTSAKYNFVNGENTYSWFIPSGIIPGDSSQFNIRPLLKNNDLSCGIKQIFTQAVITQPVLCIADSSYCDINVATSTALLTDSVEKSIFTFANVDAVAQPSGSDEKITVSYNIANLGADKANGNLLSVDLYYDDNKNGVIDSGDIFLNSDTILSEIKRGGSISITADFTISSTYVCNLMLYINDRNCVCDALWASIPPPRLLNAGNDTIACPGVPFTIGTKGNPSNSYTWDYSPFLSELDSAQTIFKGNNIKTSNDTLKLVLTTQRSGCSSSDSVQVILYPGMSANFEDTVNLCKGGSVIIGDAISGGVGRVKQYQWTPTDSLSRPQGQLTQANPDVSTKYHFTTIDNAGCMYKDSTYVMVNENPIAMMDFIDTCVGEFIQVSNASDYRGTTTDSLQWKFGDLYESQLQSFQLRVDSAQQIKIDLYVENNKGCWDTTSRFITIFPLPVANAVTYEDCQFDTTTLKAISTIENGNLTHHWTINGNTYPSDTLQYILQNETKIPFELKAISEKGCVNHFHDTLALRNKPEIGINVNAICLVDTAQFSVSIGGSTTESITLYNWDLGDGSNQSSNSFAHKYADTGTYNLILIASNAFGCSDTANATITIHPMPISSFTKQNICLDQTAEFLDNSTISNGSIQSIYWDFGSGFVIGDTNLNLFKNTPGTYTIRNKVVSNQGCADSSSNTFDVYYIEYPKMNIVGNCENELIQIKALPQQVDSISFIQWNVLTDSFTTATINYQFPSSGIFTARQTITTKQGCTSDSTFSIKIDPAPVSEIIVDKICDDNVAQFSSNGLINNWDLGDGTTSSDENFNHTYLTRGNYPIVLIVTNEFNCKDTATTILDIENFILPDFEVKDICELEGQWINNTSSGFGSPISSAEFTMGDGNIRSSLDSFFYTYQKAGTYTIDLKVSTLPGCQYTTSKTVVIHPLPLADFRIFPETADIFTSNIQFTDQSRGADSVLYYLSDGNTFSSFDFEHHFKDSGNYIITQWVISNFGCSDSITKSLYILFAYKLFVPNAFTPNGDGLNDVFRPSGLGLNQYELEIYNRWGEIIFKSDEPNQPWTGGDHMEGYYLYRIKARDFQNNIFNYKGGVYLLR